MGRANLRSLARYTDSLSHVYLEHAVIEQEDHSIAAFTPDGRITLPAANLSSVVLGPGTRITHAAIKVLADCGAVITWAGTDGLLFYACGQAKTRLSQGIEVQARYWADPALHLQVVRRMYQIRFQETLPATLTLQQIRGKEGVRVRDTYQQLAKTYGVAWNGRQYDRSSWDSADPVNQALSAANAALYAIVLAALHSLGYSPSLGFVHTGKQLSFVYDVADLVKTETSIPAAFEAAVAGAAQVESRARRILRDRCCHDRLQDRLTKILPALFNTQPPEDERAVSDAVGALWDSNGPVSGGIQYGRDDS
ncbi:MAG: type I-E CRISPR-associated endonuclease Cas1e [Synechococcaceae cyanobacterium]|jgi:CRISPR-associated protein Cas1